MLAFSIMKYSLYENFPSRYVSVTYPLLLLIFVGLGSFVSRYIPKIINNTFYKAVRYLVIVVFLIFQICFCFVDIKRVIVSEYNLNEEPKYSGVIRRLCNRYLNRERYIYVKENIQWIAQSLKYYCLPAVIVPVDRAYFDIPKNSVIITPYLMDDSRLINVTLDQKPKTKVFYESAGKKPLYTYLNDLDYRLTIK